MMETGWSRLRRRVVWAVVALLGAGLLPLYVAAAAQSSVTKLSGFSTARSAVRVGGAMWDDVTVQPRAVRTITVQYRRAGARAFTNGPAVRTSSRGVAELGLKPPAAGRWQFRAVVVASSGRARRFVSSTRTLVASGKAARTSIGGFSTRSVNRTVGQTVTADIVVKPGARRVVFVQAHSATSPRFVTQSRGRTTASGRFHAVYRATSAGLWRVRLLVRASATAGSVVSRTRVVTVAAGVDTRAPGPVTGLTVSNVGNRSATLSWRNPTDADLSGVVIRRAQGNVAPATPTAGTAVVDVVAPGKTFNDTGLNPATRYSYAVFAHDPKPNYAAPATVSVTTLAAPDRQAPGSVSDLAVTTRTRTSVSLSWANPTDEDFAGAVVRRADGNAAPVSATDGSAVADVPGFDNVVDDKGLAPDKRYTYAVFAHDGKPNYAPATTITVATRTAQTDAVLAIRELGFPDTSMNTLTQNVQFEFDASESLAGVNATNLSATLDFGDSTPPQAFAAGTNGRFDFWTVEHAYADPVDDRTVTLTVTDSVGGTDTATLHARVVPALAAGVSVTSSTAQVDLPVTFDLTSSAGGGPEPTSYELIFRDLDDVTSGTEPHEATDPPTEAFHVVGATPPTAEDVTFDKPGRYEVLFTVRNDAGGSASARTILVVAP